MMTSQHIPQGPAQAVAAQLIDAGCVTFRADEPFRLPSGWASPVYMDCRRLISFPRVRRELVAHAIERLQASGSLKDVTSIAGGEASGIAFAAWNGASARSAPAIRPQAGGWNEPGRGRRSQGLQGSARRRHDGCG